jgi:hypothetical protein
MAARKWTDEQKAKQSTLIHTWQHSTGAKTRGQGYQLNERLPGLLAAACTITALAIVVKVPCPPD